MSYLRIIWWQNDGLLTTERWQNDETFYYEKMTSWRHEDDKIMPYLSPKWRLIDYLFSENK